MSGTLKANSVSFFESMLMGVAGSAPASSIAMATAVLIGAAGVFAPVSLLIFAVPMLGIARAYHALGARGANAGASYQWTSAVFGRFLGFFCGWSLLVATLLFMVSGSVPIATATLNFVSPGYVGNIVVTALVASFWFATVAAIVVTGMTVSSRVQVVMTSIQLIILIVLLAAALIHVAIAGPANHVGPRWLGSGFSADGLAASALIAVYFYWGWDVTSNLGEETVGGGSQAGLGGLASIFVTILMYVAFAAVALLVFPVSDARNLTDNLLYNIAVESGLGRQGGLLASAAVIVSGIAALEATMLMFSRTLFAMGRDGAMPRYFGEVHPRTQAPARATYAIIILGLLLTWASALMPSVEVILTASVEALGLQVDYYFAMAGFVAAWMFRDSLKQSLWHWLSLCIFPVLSSLILTGLGLYAILTFDLFTNALALGSFALGLLFFRPGYYRSRSADRASGDAPPDGACAVPTVAESATAP